MCTEIFPSASKASPIGFTKIPKNQVEMHSHLSKVVVNIMVALWTIATLIAWSQGEDCRCSDPNAACWPTGEQWDAFNVTVGGRLIAPKPTGTPHERLSSVLVSGR